MRFLVVKGIEGLGNRLMCVANAIEYCLQIKGLMPFIPFLM